ncbi:hypothetical protein E2542_SST24620 [Spatholobus suberectus]|nr:hypothetical protein E2542_SST24620 [Spatholobus suberectus]
MGTSGRKRGRNSRGEVVRWEETRRRGRGEVVRGGGVMGGGTTGTSPGRDAWRRGGGTCDREEARREGK